MDKTHLRTGSHKPLPFARLSDINDEPEEMTPAMSDMIERVGRALAKEEGYAYDPYPYNVRARVAIEALSDSDIEELRRKHGDRK